MEPLLGGGGKLAVFVAAKNRRTLKRPLWKQNKHKSRYTRVIRAGEGRRGHTQWQQEDVSSSEWSRSCRYILEHGDGGNNRAAIQDNVFFQIRHTYSSIHMSWRRVRRRQGEAKSELNKQQIRSRLNCARYSSQCRVRVTICSTYNNESRANGRFVATEFDWTREVKEVSQRERLVNIILKWQF